MNDITIPAELVDRVFESLGGHGNPDIKWHIVQQIASAVQANLVNMPPTVNLEAARQYLDTMRRVIDSRVEGDLRENLLLSVNDIKEALGG